MKTTESYILSFVKVLANHPKEVTVKQINDDPVVFEIMVSKQDLVEVSSKHKAIQAIAGQASGLLYSQFVLKIIGK